METCYDCAVDGGSCLAFKNVFQCPAIPTDITTTFRLFRTRIDLESSETSFGVEVSYLPQNGSMADVGVVLVIESSDPNDPSKRSRITRVNCGCPGSSEHLLRNEVGEGKQRNEPPCLTDEVVVHPQNYSSELQPWKRHLYQVYQETAVNQLRSAVITDIYLVCFLAENVSSNSEVTAHHYDLRLGSLKILPISS